jgi:hypothetical protein
VGLEDPLSDRGWNRIAAIVYFDEGSIPLLVDGQNNRCSAAIGLNGIFAKVK